MSDPSILEPAVREVLADYEARSAREAKRIEGFSAEDFRAHVDELLLEVGPATGALLDLLIRESGARRILEVGSSYGYSTLWLARAARLAGGRVVSLELRANKVDYARQQLARAGLEGYVEFHIGDALESLRRLPGPFDLVLLDLWKELYLPVFELLQPKLAAGALIVADNMLQPESTRPQAEAYRARVRAATGMSSVLLAVGNGLEISRYL